MPKPRKRERKKHFIKRCIPYMFDNEPETLTSKDKKSKQAYAICNSFYDKRNENHIFNFNQLNETNYDDFLNLRKTISDIGYSVETYRNGGEIELIIDNKKVINAPNNLYGLDIINVYLSGVLNGLQLKKS